MTHIDEYMYIYTYICKCMYVYIYMHTPTYAYIYIYSSICVIIRVNVTSECFRELDYSRVVCYPKMKLNPFVLVFFLFCAVPSMMLPF